MIKELKVFIKRSFLDNYQRPLHIHPEYISFENRDTAKNGVTIFKASEIKDFRCGITWYRYHFIFGREYQFYIRNYKNEVLKINFNSYFGIKKKEKQELYSKIIDSLWSMYFEKQIKDFLNEFKAGESFFIGDAIINPEGIIINVSKLIKQEKVLIVWEDVRFKLYSTYISIFSKNNALKINRGYSYKEDWNTFVLYNVIKTILSNKNINND